MNLHSRAIRKLKYIRGYIRSLVLGSLNSGKYRDIETFILFIGYPRSGHSLVAALLDAHPDIMISMEWGVLSHVRMGYGRNQIFYSIERHSRLFTNKLKNIWTGYNYRVEGMWQGKSEEIHVSGDKLAGRTSLILDDYPDLLDKLKMRIKRDLKLIHVIRNPFDTISTMARRSLEKSANPGVKPDLAGFSDKYFKRVRLVESLKLEGRNPVFDLYHEDFIREPARSLQNLLEFLDLEPIKGYLEKCSEIVFSHPHESRYQYDWSEELIKSVQAKIDSYDFLARYSFNT